MYSTLRSATQQLSDMVQVWKSTIITCFINVV